MIKLLITNLYLMTRKDIAAILLLIAVAGGLLFVHVVAPKLGSSNSGFGPNWECTNPGEGESVCIKKLPIH